MRSFDPGMMRLSTGFPLRERICWAKFDMILVDLQLGEPPLPYILPGVRAVPNVKIYGPNVPLGQPRYGVGRVRHLLSILITQPVRRTSGFGVLPWQRNPRSTQSRWPLTAGC